MQIERHYDVIGNKFVAYHHQEMVLLTPLKKKTAVLLHGAAIKTLKLAMLLQPVEAR